MVSLSRTIGRLVGKIPLPQLIFLKILDYVLLLVLIYGAYRLFDHYRHRIPGRSWDNY